MKYLVTRGIGFLLAFFAFVPGMVCAAERITSFDSAITIAESGRMTVVETIRYDFGEAEKHGIFRSIPLPFEDAQNAEHHLDIDLVSVTDEDGTPYGEQLEGDRDLFRVRIGDPDITVTGEQTYIITYTTDDAVAFLDDRDELYWNITGNEWEVPIIKIHATVSLPGGIPSGQIASACYQGVFGSSDVCNTFMSTTSPGTVEFVSLNSLLPNEGMTIAAGFPQGFVEESPYIAWKRFLRSLWFYVDLALGIFLPVVVGGLALRAWYYRGRDPEGRSVIVPEYESPADLSVLEAAYVLRESIKQEDISAGILALAAKGALRIERVDTKVLLVFSKTDYRLVRTGDTTQLLPIERKLLDILFDPLSGATGDTLLLSDMKPASFVSKVTELKRAAGDELVQKGYFTKNPYNAAGWLVIAAVLMPIAGLVAFFVGGLGFTFFGCVVAAAICGVCARLMPQKTAKGALAHDTLLGLKQYINVAEKARIEFHNAPAKTPELFEKLLPFAMMFGLTEIWTAEFADIMKENPSWYTSSTAFNASAFGSDLSHFGSAFATTTSTHSSGSGGGGSSGGGGGGGGGGSW